MDPGYCPEKLCPTDKVGQALCWPLPNGRVFLSALMTTLRRRNFPWYHCQNRSNRPPKTALTPKTDHLSETLKNPALAGLCGRAGVVHDAVFLCHMNPRLWLRVSSKTSHYKTRLRIKTRREQAINPFECRRANDASDRYLVRLETLAGIRLF